MENRSHLWKKGDFQRYIITFCFRSRLLLFNAIDIDARSFEIASWFDNHFPDDHFSYSNKPNSSETVSQSDLEILLQKVLDPPKKGLDHCGQPLKVLKLAPKLVETLLQGKCLNNAIDDDRLTIALMTLRDHSRAGFMTAYMHLVQLSVNSPTYMQKSAQHFLSIFEHTKYKSKLTQVYNCCKAFLMMTHTYILVVYTRKLQGHSFGRSKRRRALHFQC